MFFSLAKILLPILVVTMSTLSWAKLELDYPELLVTPRASERLKMEAIFENRGTWDHVPIQVSSAMTLTAGILQMSDVDKTKDEDERSPYVGMAVGGGWLLATFLMDAYYNPYTEGYTIIAKLPEKNKRDQLTKERLAEEALENAASMGKKLMWFSTVSNLFASAYMLTKAKSDSNAVIANALAAITSFAPVLFRYHWQKVAKEQRSYKKKIYGPVSFSPMLYEPGAHTFVPGALVGFTF